MEPSGFTSYSSPITHTQQFFSSYYSPLPIVFVVILLISICCCLYKMCCKSRPTTTHTTAVTTIPQQYPPQPVQYPPYQPVPGYGNQPMQQGYGVQPMPTMPYHGQHFTPGPPPTYQEAIGPVYPPNPMPYSQAVFPPASRHALYGFLSSRCSPMLHLPNQTTSPSQHTYVAAPPNTG